MSWWRAILWRQTRDADVDKELRFHIDQQIEEHVRAGMSRADAARRTRLEFGGVEQVKEECRDVRPVRWLHDMGRDARYAIRMLCGSPSFTIAALVTLALGIGVNSAMFSFSDATAFRPPDVPRPAELVRVFGSTREVPYGRVSYPDYLDYRNQLTTLSGVAAYDTALVAMSRTGSESPQLLGGWMVSGNLFSVLDIHPDLGRTFRVDEDQPGGNAVVIISHSLWVRRFDSDPNIVGTHVQLGRREFTIIGVTPAGFGGTELYFHPDLYIPIAKTREIQVTVPENVLQDRSSRWLNVVGRLKPNASIRTANAEIVALSQSLEQSYVDTNRGVTANVLPEVGARGKLDEGGYQGAALSLWLVGVVLLIACANVANLMLARATGRNREIAVRLALGASRSRLVRQLLTESVVLASAGGALGLIVAYSGIGYLSRALANNFAVTDLPLSIDARIDGRVLFVTLVASMATGILFGLTPAFHSTRVDVISALKASAKSGGGHRWFKGRHVLVAAQIALSVVVLAVAGLSIRGFLDKQQLDPGFKTDHVLLMSFNPALVNYSEDQTSQFYRQVVERTKTIPGVLAAGLAQYVPLGVNGGQSRVVVDGYQMPKGQERLSIASNVVDAGYWAAMRISIVRGRPFDERDSTSSPNVVIVNETMARRYWPDQDALGHLVHLRDRNGPAMEVVGIAKDGKYGYLAEPPQPFLFMPSSQRFHSSMTMVVLAKGEVTTLVAPIRAQVQALGPRVAVFDVRTFDDLYQSRALMSSRLVAQIMTFLAGFAMVLAVVGLYGVIAYLTSLRTREIGIRTAIGADHRTVLRLVLKQAVPMVGPGLLLGSTIAFFVTPAFAMPFDFAPRDHVVLALVPLLLGAAAFAASLVPARRASRFNPSVALRHE